MRPKRKVLPRMSPDLLKRLIPEALAIRYEGMVYDESRPCPECGCEEVIRHDMDERVFCITIVDDGFKPIKIQVKRFRCKKCGHVFDGKKPFYDGCDYASPIVDLCLALASSNPYNRVESILMQYGIQVDRDTVRNYAILFRDRAVKYAGIPVMDDSKIGVNILKILFDVDGVEELRRLYPQAKYDATMDETYPRMKGAKKALAEQRYVKKVSGERQPKYPESFTLAASYMNHLKCFSSISCRNAPFNSIVAETLAKPLKGSEAIITDGSECYDNVRSYRCLWHKMKNFSNTDPFLCRARHSKEKLPPWIISSHIHNLYTMAEEEYMNWLKKKYPDLVDEETGEYVGATTTNSMEGGNWRLKYELRADYTRDESIEGRCILIALKDSTHTFKHGRPSQTFGTINSNFQYSAVMQAHTQQTPLITVAAA